MDSIADILRDSVSILSTSNNLTVCCLKGEDLLWQTSLGWVLPILFLVDIPKNVGIVFIYICTSDEMFLNSSVIFT